MLEVCLPRASDSVRAAVQKCVTDYTYTVVVMCCVLAALLDSTVLTTEHVDMVGKVLEVELEKRAASKKTSKARSSKVATAKQSGGNGIPFTGLGANGYSSSFGAGVQASTVDFDGGCLLYTSPSPRDGLLSRMPSSA